ELPGVRRTVVPQVRAGIPVVRELVAHRCPRLAAVVGALDQLSEPAAGLRGIQPVRVHGRALHMVNLPAAKMGAADVPAFALAVRGENECPLTRTNQNPYSAHVILLRECNGDACRPEIPPEGIRDLFGSLRAARESSEGTVGRARSVADPVGRRFRPA